MSFKNNIIINGISLAGFSHIEKNIPCQDGNAFKFYDNKYILAVTDGAGSCKHSHLASKFIAEKLVNNLDPSELLEKTNKIKFKLELINFINDSFAELITRESSNIPDIKMSDLATTLILVIGNQERGFIFHVGDGAALILDSKNMENFIISEPMNGQYANETYFITMKKWEDHLRIREFDIKFDSIFLFSDGVTPLSLIKGKKPFEGFLSPLINHIKKNKNKDYMNVLKNTLNSERVRKITDDDKTIAFLLKSD